MPTSAIRDIRVIRRGSFLAVDASSVSDYDLMRCNSASTNFASTRSRSALGVFYVFRDPAEQQDFLSARSRRRIDWTQISARLGLGGPRTLWKALYDQHRDLLDAFWNRMLELGRLPEPEEFSQTSELRARIGSPKQALRLFLQKGGGEEMKRAEENRRRDLLVYVALANLRKRVPFGHLSSNCACASRSTSAPAGSRCSITARRGNCSTTRTGWFSPTHSRREQW